jgi:hexosaminidase
MLDTANHYLSPATIVQTLDVMAANRFNVLHWHVMDSYSFPLQMPAAQPWAGLSAQGSWTPQAVYTPQQVIDIVEYARLRGECDDKWWWV